MPEPEFAPAPGEHNPLRVIFVGSQGVRAGWRLLVFFALLTVLSAAAVLLQRRFVHRVSFEFSAANIIRNESISFGILLIATAIMGRFEHRRLADYGLPARRALGKQFWTGALWGFVMLSVIIAMMAGTHAYSPGGLALSPLEVLKFALLWDLGFLMVGLFEEFAFRGYMQFTLTTGLGFWPAAAITCIVFAGLHLGNPGENRIGAVEIVLIALFLCLALRRTGNLWFAIGWHMSFDWGESFFYSTPNSGIHATGHMLNASLMGSKWLSGGTVGPEASVFDLVVTIAGILLLAKIYPEAKYPVLAPTGAPGPSDGLPATPATETVATGTPN
ncbi:MAG: type II CAAX endopeptidase family protein [Candidatus Korobacteraceae bacterium]|jgi:membrane protease YdiL (CAAX protease family)